MRRLLLRRLLTTVAFRYLAIAGLIAVLASCGSAGPGSGAGNGSGGAGTSPFEATGYEFLESWGATDGSGEPVAGWGPGEFDNPFDIGFYNGKLFVADTNNDRIQVLETDGTFVEEFSDPGTGSGQFTSPREIFVDPLGNR